MNFVLDTHSHTIASGHAYSTINELAYSAKQKNLKLICITDHAPEMPGSTSWIYFRNFKIIDRFINDVEVFMGSELNILDFDGNVDIPQDALSKLDMAIASFHPICTKPGTIEENTRAFLNVMENPYVNIIGHPEDGNVPIDFVAVVKKAKQTNTLIELNNSSLKSSSTRLNTRENAKKLLDVCKHENALITIGSDAHFSTAIGNHDCALEVINEVDFPHDLIINTDVDKFKNFINQKRKNNI